VEAELAQNIAGWGKIQGAMNEFRAWHDDTARFFTGMFEELGSLYESLVLQEQRMEKQASIGQDTVAESDTAGDSRWDLLFKEYEEDRAELRRTEQVIQQQLVQLSAVATDLAGAQNEFNTVRSELARHGDELAAARSQTASASQESEGSIKNKIHELEQQQSSLEKERAVLESELEAVRRRAAEMADSLAEQKRLAAQQQGQWAEDLRQMRALLETMAQQFAQSRRQSDSMSAIEPTPAVAAAALTDPVLESVLAQFEILQQDRLRRRPANPESTRKKNH